jgi:hypothetical protein
MPDTSRRAVLTGAAGLAAGLVAGGAAAASALPASLPMLPLRSASRPSPADLHEMGRRIGPYRVIMDVGLIQEAIDALDDYQLFDSPEERRLIAQLEEALYSRPSLIGLRDGPGCDI